ncbi:MAG TPA: hypothetical protein VMV29_00550 [Ktedonobacterales bacterium]|nr:hypothetical protein [Ktedonobacterales bacterium]
MRLQLAESNKRLNAAAQEAGVNSQSFGRLHRAGTMALYGGLTVEQVKDHKGIEQREDHADRMGRAELAVRYHCRAPFHNSGKGRMTPASGYTLVGGYVPATCRARLQSPA